MDQLMQKKSGRLKIKLWRNWFESGFYHASIFKIEQGVVRDSHDHCGCTKSKNLYFCQKSDNGKTEKYPFWNWFIFKILFLSFSMWSSLMTMEWKTVEILRKMLLEQNKNPFSQATTLFYCAKSKEKKQNKQNVSHFPSLVRKMTSIFACMTVMWDL